MLKFRYMVVAAAIFLLYYRGRFVKDELVSSNGGQPNN